MARVVLPLDTDQKDDQACLSTATGLSVTMVLDLRRRGYKVVKDDLDQWSRVKLLTGPSIPGLCAFVSFHEAPMRGS